MAVIRQQCDFRWIVLSLALSVVSQIIRAWRWKLQLNALEIYPSFFQVVLSIFGTYAVNIVFPRLGEIWRTGYIAARRNAPFATVFGSMIADRAADVVLVLVLTLVTLGLASPALAAFVARYPDAYNAIGSILTSPITWVCIAVVTAMCWWLYTRYSKTKFILKVRHAIVELWQGFAVVFKMEQRLLWIVLWVSIWSCYFLQLYFTFYAFPFTYSLLETNGVICVLVAFVLSSIAMGIPSNGGMGPWQIAIIFALSLYAPAGMSAAQADTFRLNLTAFANLVLGTELLLMILLGIFTFICIAFAKSKKTII